MIKLIFLLLNVLFLNNAYAVSPKTINCEVRYISKTDLSKTIVFAFSGTTNDSGSLYKWVNDAEKDISFTLAYNKYSNGVSLTIHSPIPRPGNELQEYRTESYVDLEKTYLSVSADLLLKAGKQNVVFICGKFQN